MEALTENLKQVMERFTIQNLIGALVVFVFCYFANKIFLKLVRKGLEKSRLTPQVRMMVQRILKIGLWLVAGLIIAAELGFDTTSLVALVSVLSLGITLAMEDILGNVAGGVVLASTKSVAVGDYIALPDVSGTVKLIHLNYTVLSTPDGLTVTVPNKAMASSKITNYTSSGRRRIVIEVGASYRDETEKVRKALMELMTGFDTVLTDPAPMVYLTSYGESSITYTMYCWTKAADFMNTKWLMVQQIRDAFEANGISMDYNHMNVHMIRD